MIEKRKRHYYFSYGRWIEGYGPSMDPHVCGERDERCYTVYEQRSVGEWQKTGMKKVDGESVVEWFSE